LVIDFNLTKDLIVLVLRHPQNLARDELHRALQKISSTEGAFYESIIHHQAGLRKGPNALTTDQWFDLLSKLPNRVLRSGVELPAVLSEAQLERLPPPTG
jgi:hypothetical protein